MRLLVRGEILESRYVTADNRTRFKEAVVRVSGRRLRVVVADLGSNPLVSRRTGFEALEELLNPGSHLPLIVMGDFNTPIESVHFNPLRSRGLTHAFVSSGHGFSETWPAFLPLLSLDHIWIGPGLRSIGCKLQRSPASDHLSVLAAINAGAD